MLLNFRSKQQEWLYLIHNNIKFTILIRKTITSVIICVWFTPRKKDIYSNILKFRTLFSFFSQIVIRAGIRKMSVRIANREDLDGKGIIKQVVSLKKIIV